MPKSEVSAIVKAEIFIPASPRYLGHFTQSPRFIFQKYRYLFDYHFNSDFTVINYSFCFSGGAFNGFWFNQFYVHRNSQGTLNVMRNLFSQCLQFPYFVGEKLFLHFHHQFQYIECAFAFNNEQVVWFGFTHFEQHTFNLRREYIYTANN